MEKSQISPHTGLNSEEVKIRLQKYGFNEVDEDRLTTTLENLLKILSDPMGLMLLFLSVVYWVLGKHTDTIILLIAYVPIVGVDVLLELRSQKALRSLKSTLKSTCHVLRDGKNKIISTKELVPGDLLLLEEGQTLPADGKLLEVSNLTIDESSVTGESVPIEKIKDDGALSGTTILTGTGILEIEKTGLASQIGSIAKVLKEFEAVPSPLLRTIRKAVKIVFLVAIVLAFAVFIINILKSHGIGESLISSLTLAMAAIPEEFPLVFTLYLSLAAYRLSKKGILVKSLPAVEGLGRVDVICTDKTGTLTEGKFLLDRILGAHGDLRLSDDECKAFVFSCEPKAIDAMEASMFEYIRKMRGDKFVENIHSSWNLQHDYPFDTKEKYMSHVWTNSSGQQVMAMKGAIEGVLAHCEDATDYVSIQNLAKAEAGSGKRLLGLAMKKGPFTGDRKSDESSLCFIGILSFTDPVRPTVKSAIQACVERGIKIKMLTGDHLLTAHAIADKINLPHEHDQLFTGPNLASMPEETRQAAYQKGAIFARLKPEQKLELVEALKSEGDIVAMTGDGINDAPALKLADVGISMGERATDVARSTAQLVLMKNDFGGIVHAVIEGERVLGSLGQSFGYLIAFHIPIIGVALYQSFFLNEAILHPIHIVLMELIVHPVSAFVFDESSRSSSTPRKQFVTRSTAAWSSLRGIMLSTFCILIFYFASGTSAQRSSLSVLGLIAGNIGLLLGEKGGIISAIVSSASKRTLLASVLLLVLAYGLAFVPLLSRLFLIEPPATDLFLLVTLVGIAIGWIARP
jgi:Ca2+-transporting ATPase